MHHTFNDDGNAEEGFRNRNHPQNGAAKQNDGSYNFESVLRYSAEAVSSLDYAVANLETTFGGPSRPHVANQSFCCPDELAANAKEVGYDMFLTANIL